MSIYDVFNGGSRPFNKEEWAAAKQAQRQEAYEMIEDAFDYSEKYHTPVLFRPTTRICHGCASVELKERISLPAPQGFVKDPDKWVIFPRLSNANHKMIEARNPVIGEDFSTYRFNLVHREEKETIQGIITHGISYEFVMEALNGYKGCLLYTSDAADD